MGLFNGFLRSLINQVGRDTGRQISREVYGNQRSTKQGLLTTVINILKKK